MTFIKKYSNSNSITLKKYEGDGLEVVNKEHAEKLSLSQDNIRIAFLDLETTGTDINKSEVIEIAIKAISINKIDGSSLAAINKYESLNEPSIQISEEITKINVRYITEYKPVSTKVLAITVSIGFTGL